MDRPPAQRVEVAVSARTVVVLLAVGAIVALVLLSLGTLLSVFVAAVLALGLDPVVGALVRRGRRRGRAALAVFAGLFASVFALVLVTAGPLWDQIVEFVHALPGYWDDLTNSDAFQSIVSTGAPTTPSAIVLREAGSPRRARMAALRGS